MTKRVHAFSTVTSVKISKSTKAVLYKSRQVENIFSLLEIVLISFVVYIHRLKPIFKENLQTKYRNVRSYEIKGLVNGVVSG